MAKTNAPGRICAVMQHHYMLVDTDPVYRSNRRRIEIDTHTARLAARINVLTIPVVVHVIYHTDAEDLPEEQIHAQIDALNRDYRLMNSDKSDIPSAFQERAADTMIEFKLAVRDPQGSATTGITRTHTSKTVFPYSDTDPRATQKLDKLIKHDEFGKAAWPRDSYLNLWTCSINGGLLGYAQFPGGPAATDGVVILNTAFGTGGIARPPFDLGRTAVHEVGHWLNLLHIWGDDRGGCQGSDNVDDTPNQAGPNSGPSITKDSFPHVTCNNAPNGDMFMNYMDYVDDKVMVMFSKGQLQRMNATLAGPRASLANSQGLVPLVTEPLASLAGERGFAELGNESGTRPTLVFDGVSWVPAN